MALVGIEVLEGRTADERRRMLDSVRAALVEALAVPEDDPTLRLVEHAPDHFVIPPRHSDRYTVVEVTMFRGRSLTAKRRLYEAVVRNLAALDIPARDVLVLVHEPEMENWGVSGGLPASEVDVGFKVDV